MARRATVYRRFRLCRGKLNKFELKGYKPNISMKLTVEFDHFALVHQLQRRIRIIATSLCKDRERAYILEMLLLKRQGVESVKVVPAIGSVTIRFNPDTLPQSNLLLLLESVIRNIGRKPQQAIHAMRRRDTCSGQPQDFVIGIGGMSCASCAMFLEMVLQRESDIVTDNVNYVSEIARIKGYLTRESLFKIIKVNGYQAYSIDSLTERKLLFESEQKHLTRAKTQLLGLGLLSFPVALLGMMRSQSRTLILLQALFAAPVIFWGGRDIFKKALLQAKQKSANMDSMIALGVAAAYSYSLPALFRRTEHVYFEAATSIIDFVLVGRYLEEAGKYKVVQEIRKLVNLQPQGATLLQGNDELSISAEQIKTGDILLIRPGKRIPADGKVIKGVSSVNEAMVTGSVLPCIKEAGHQLYDGSINGSGILQMRVTASGKDTLLSGLVHMVDQAQTSRLAIQKTADKLSAIFVPVVMALSGLTFSGWMVAGEPIAHALANAISVLLISCPCALGLATPAATIAGTGQAARRGIYIRNGEALETAATIDIVIFDKTGTITEGNINITDLVNVSEMSDEEVIQLAASAEFNSGHFLGRAIVHYAQERSIALLKSSQFHNIPDKGIRAHVADHTVLLGRESWLDEQNVDSTALQATSKEFSQQGKILMILAIDGQAAALFAAADPIRPNAARVIQHLHAGSVETLMVTGDTETAARFIGKQVGITEIIAQADPAQKLRIVRSLQKQGRRVAMIGDGSNDAPALAAADVSFVVDLGADIAIQAADLVLVNGDIGKAAEAMQLSKQTLSIIKQNLFWAFGYNAVAIPLAVAGRLNPTIASAAMALSSVSVIANSLRLNRIK